MSSPDATLRNLGSEIPGINALSQNFFKQFQGDINADPRLSAASGLSTSLMDFASTNILPGAKKIFDVGMNTVLPAGINTLQTGQDIMNAGSPDVINTLKNHGALSGWQERDVADATQAAASGMGMGHSLGTLGERLMNRGEMQYQNVNRAVGLGGQLANIGGSTLSAPAQSLPYLAAPGAAVSSTIQPALATEATAASTFNPQIQGSMNYSQDLFDFNANAQNAASIDSANKEASLIGSGIKAVGSLAGGAMMMSDERVKEDVKDTGFKVHGIPVKTFKFIGSDDTQLGVIAQDVDEIMPEAVHRLPSGRLLVNYDKLLKARAA